MVHIPGRKAPPNHHSFLFLSFFWQVDEAVGAALAKQVEVMVDELHQEEAELEKEPPEGQEVNMPYIPNTMERGPRIPHILL